MGRILIRRRAPGEGDHVRAPDLQRSEKRIGTVKSCLRLRSCSPGTAAAAGRARSSCITSASRSGWPELVTIWRDSTWPLRSTVKVKHHDAFLVARLRLARIALEPLQMLDQQRLPRRIDARCGGFDARRGARRRIGRLDLLGRLFLGQRDVRRGVLRRRRLRRPWPVPAARFPARSARWRWPRASSPRSSSDCGCHNR